MGPLSAWLAPEARLRRTLRRVPEAAVDAGVPPAWLGHRWVARETVREHLRRREARGEGARAGSVRTVQPEATASNPLPRNVASRDELPAERGWWGFSFRDVPERVSGETFVATLPDCRVVFCEDARRDVHVAVLTADGRALRMREIAFRPGHARALRAGARPARLERAAWLCERVWHNYSHWLTAHVTKLCVLRDEGLSGDVVLPPERGGFVEATLRRLGLDPDAHATFDPRRPLEVGELTLVGHDRFRPELLRAARDALASPSAAGARRVFVSRARCARRRLANEERLWPALRAAGFERVAMEALSFDEQARLMGETAVLLAPHGAGLTNMLLCRAGTHVVELADLGFPNPNFYALASALGHPYWLVPARPVGEGHPLERDLVVDEGDVAAVLDAVLAELP